MKNKGMMNNSKSKKDNSRAEKLKKGDIKTKTIN